MLSHLNENDSELSVLLTDDRTIKALNHDYRSKNRPTDVLAFPQDADSTSAASGKPAARSSVRLLGDVVISLDTAHRQANKRRHSLMDEVIFLLAHGVLHLLGYDHQTDAQERRMNALTQELVRVAKQA